MAAALLQYQACLGIMVRLQVEDLTLLKEDFDRMGRGLSLSEFVSVMLDRVSWEQENVLKFIEDLVELFAQVDVNGDGAMEWEEFTSAIIEGGMGASSDDEAHWRGLQYEENLRFADLVNRPPKRVQLAPEFRRLLLYENTRPVVEIIDPSTLFLTESESDGGHSSSGGAAARDIAAGIDSLTTPRSTGGENGSMFTPTLSIVNNFHPLCYIAGYRRDQDEVRSERSPVQALKYLNRVELLAVSAGDLKLTFWATTILTATSASALETPVPLAVVHTPRPQRVLEWDAGTQRLFSISADLMITVWLVEREKKHDSKGRCDVTLVTTLKKHTDLLQDLLVLNAETLVSCGMDSMIYLWDTQSLQLKAVRQGHRRGVRLLTKLSSQIFISAGFECEVLGWDISALATTPIFKLWGHTSPVCCIQLISSAAFASLNESRMSAAQTSASAAAAAAAAMLGDQAITVDDDGWFKWWNLASVLSIENNDLEKSNSRCLQTFRVGSDKYPWKAHSLVVLNNGQSILATGLHKLKLLHRVRLKPQVLASSVVLYNSVSFTLLTTTDKELRIWDASSGALIRTYSNLTTSDITCVDLDARQRKIVFGTQSGELFVLNYLNGAVLKQWTPHQLQISALLYCKEDQCVLTASWDRSLRLYDDNASTNALLRCITDAHDTDIKCLAYCYALSLFASGSTDGTIKIWDYIYFLLEDTCVLGGGGNSTSAPVTGAGQHYRRGSTTGGSNDSSVTAVVSHPMVACDVNALEFIEPYPLLLSGHENGMVCIWSLSPTQPTALLLCFYPLLSAPSPAVVPPTPNSSNSSNGSGSGHEHSLKSARGGSVSCCRVFYDEEGGEVMKNDIRRGRFLLITGSNHGEICVSDVSRVITKSFVKAFREESLPSHHHRSYNPRRRFLRQGKNAKRLRNKHSASASSNVGSTADGTTSVEDGGPGGEGTAVHHQLSIDETDVLCVAKWKAHQGNIRCLNTVDEPRAIFTCASDKSVCLWDFQGVCLGNLAQSKNNNSGGGDGQKSSEPGSTPSGNRQDVSWQWKIDLESATQAKREQAEAIWDQMKATKLKSAGTRHQSVIEISRRRRKSSVMGGGEMRAGASAPALGAGSSAQPETTTLYSSRDEPSASSTKDADANYGDGGEGRRAADESTTKGEAERLFEQLQGKETWKQSDFQAARQVAWDRERTKFQQRMKKIMKSGKHSARSSGAASAISKSGVNEYGQPVRRDGEKQQQSGDRSGETAPSLDNQDEDDELLHHSASSDAALLAVFENPAQELPFGDKDNWGVGSLNRERQMYAHLHHENVRRSQKSLVVSGGSSGGVGLGGGSRLKKSNTLQSLEQIDLAPSAFLLEKLGSSCVVVENLPPTAKKHTTPASHKRKKSLLTSTRHTQSTPALSSTSTKAVAEKLPQERTEGGKDQSNTEDDATQLVPHHSMQQLILQYDQLLQTQQAEQEQLHRTSKLLTRAVTVRKMSSTQHQIHPEYPNDEDSSVQKPLKVSSAPSNRQHPTNSHAAAAGVERPISSAKAKRTTKEPGIVIPETAAAKKLRMRSDAALLRQDHFGPHSRDDVVNIYRTFQKIDRDHSGSITLRELVDGSGLFGGTHLQDNVMSIFSSIDKNQSGHIDLPELLTAIFGGGDAPAGTLQDIFRFCNLLEAAEKAKNAAKKRQLTPEQIKELYALFKVRSAVVCGHYAC